MKIDDVSEEEGNEGKLVIKVNRLHYFNLYDGYAISRSIRKCVRYIAWSRATRITNFLFS